MPADTAQLRKELIRRFNAEARPLSSEALHSLAKFVSSSDEDVEAVIQNVLSQLTVGDSPTVTVEDIDNLIRRIEQQDASEDIIQVIGAFKVPRFEWDGSHKRFVKCLKAPSLHPEPSAKPGIVLGRLQMIRQSILRDDRFQGRALNSELDRSSEQLTHVKALVGTQGERRTVLGMLRKCDKGKLLLEDVSGSVPLAGMDGADASGVQGFLAEGACMLVQGQMQASGSLRALSVEDPPMELRDSEVASLRGLNMSGANPLRPATVHGIKQRNYADEEKRLVFLSGCFLEDPTILRAITAIFHGYEHLEEGPPVVFVFIGPFFRQQRRCPKLGLEGMQAAFRALAAAIDLFPAIKAASKMVFVPAESDPGDFGTLPQRSVLASVAEPLLSSDADVTLASNPCRIHFFTKEVVVFASPCIEAFQARSLLQRPRETDPEEVFRRTCHTVLSQRHLAPLPLAVQPVHWDYDASLSLFPKPHAFVLPLQGLTHSLDLHGVRCICPGSLDVGTFVAYVPSSTPEADESAEDESAQADKPTQQAAPVALVEECEVPIEAAEAADGDLDSELSLDAVLDEHTLNDLDVSRQEAGGVEDADSDDFGDNSEDLLHDDEDGDEEEEGEEAQGMNGDCSMNTVSEDET